MIWLAAHMWFLLALAFLTGLGVGWWIWGARTSRVPSARGDAPMGTLDSDAPSDMEEQS